MVSRRLRARVAFLVGSRHGYRRWPARERARRVRRAAHRYSRRISAAPSFAAARAALSGLSQTYLRSSRLLGVRPERHAARVSDMRTDPHASVASIQAHYNRLGGSAWRLP